MVNIKEKVKNADFKSGNKENSKPTKSQHYIPRQLLKYHAIADKNNNYKIWQYDKTGKLSDRQVTTDSVCFQNYLYEFRDEENAILTDSTNYLEKWLSRQEQHFDSLIRKISNREDLTEEDFKWCHFMIATQLLRTPEIIKHNTNFIIQFNNKYSDKTISELQAANYARYSSIFHGDTNETGNPLLMWLLDEFCDYYSMIIWCSDKQFLLNGSRPVLCLQVFEEVKPLWIFPVTSNHCIVLSTGKFKAAYMDIDDNCVDFINNYIWNNKSHFIYSKERLSIAEKIKYSKV